MKIVMAHCFHGMLIPFGALISYRPPPGKEGVELLKFEPRIRKGIFMGYHFHSGGRWSGDYVVLDCERYAMAESPRQCHPFRVKEVILTSGAHQFPISGKLRSPTEARIVHDHEQAELVWGADDEEEDDVPQEPRWRDQKR